MGNRDNDQTLMECEDCDWRGKPSECIHNHVTNYPEDIIFDTCPKCGSENLIVIEHRGSYR